MCVCVWFGVIFVLNTLCVVKLSVIFLPLPSRARVPSTARSIVKPQLQAAEISAVSCTCFSFLPISTCTADLFHFISSVEIDIAQIIKYTTGTGLNTNNCFSGATKKSCSSSSYGFGFY